ncbi:MAG: SipW-dependent-type signal peptide-containing protein [Propionibacteriaceae bacterium]|jgi:predicted ribosomally synthesized peptide with SipW-like signal peptide|nr:SipW-dependent-type signal peptide-containing protein [Propionibacteriaceae bacterium]
MTNRSPIVIATTEKRGRRAGLVAAAATGFALLLGGTLAAWTDSEWINASDNGGFSLTDADYNLQISKTALSQGALASTLTWADTSEDDQTADGPFETSLTQKFSLGQTSHLLPGWQETSRFHLKNASTAAKTSLSVLIPAGSVTGEAATATAHVKDYLTFDITVQVPTIDNGGYVTGWTKGTELTGQTLSQLATAQELVAVLDAGEWVSVDVTVHFDDQLTLTGANALSMQDEGDTAKFLLQFAGEYVV